MRSRLRRTLETPDTAAAARDAWLAYRRARDHWKSCEQCRNAAAASASQWCELGLELMKGGVATNPHWDSCRRCQEAQAGVRSRQCGHGRDLDDAYQVASQRLAAGQLKATPLGD